MATAGLKLRHLLTLVALAGLAFGAQKTLGRRACCLRQVAEFHFGKEFNEQRFEALEQKIAGTKNSLSMQIYSDELKRAQVEAERCAMAEKMYQYVADHPWLSLPPAQPGYEYAPYRSHGSNP